MLAASKENKSGSEKKKANENISNKPFCDQIRHFLRKMCNVQSVKEMLQYKKVCCLCKVIFLG